MSNKFAEALKKKKQPIAELANENVSEQQSSASYVRPSRKATKHIGGYFAPEVSKQLRQIALNEDKSVQSLLAEALDMIFHSRQMPTIAQAKRDVYQ